MKPEVELITTGAELLNGTTLNRHAQWLGAELDARGWKLVRDTTVPDDRAAIREAMLGALSRCEVVLMSGGLGPTSDDVTRDVVAEWMGTGLVMHEPSRQVVLDIYARRNKPLNNLVERHALVVEGATVLANNNGLAPGEYVEKDGRHLFLLPGPPNEFQGIVREHVLPWLKERRAGVKTRCQIFQTAGPGESDMVAKLNEQGFDQLKVEAAFCAAPSRVRFRIEEVEGQAGDFDRAVEIARTCLSEFVFAESAASMEEIVSELLREREQSFAVAESCTGGLVGQRITALPGSSAVFAGGIIAYHNDVKSGVLGVPVDLLAQHGAVSEPVASAMAEGVRQVTGADYGVALTGVAGPGGGTAEKPVGLVYVAVADARGTEVKMLRLGGGRETIRLGACFMALDLLRRRLT